MSKKVKVWGAVILVLIASLAAWSVVNHEVHRTTRSSVAPAKQRSTKAATPTWTAQKMAVDLDKSQAASLDDKMAQIRFVGSVLIVRHGKVMYEKQFGQSNAATKRQNRQDTAYPIDSIQKLATGALIMQQVQKHRLSLDDHISRFYPTLPHANEITIRQMLDMTSGLHLADPVGPTMVETDAEVVNYDLNHVTFDQNMYGKWHYAQVNYNLLAGVLMKITGKSYQTLFEKQFVHRFGLQQTVFMPSTDQHVAVAYEGNSAGDVDYGKAVVTPDAFWHDELGTGRVAMSARDLYTLISGVLQGKVISPAAVKTLYTSGSSSTYGGGTYNLYDAAVNHGLGYGYQAMSCVSKDGQDAVIMLGNSYRSDHSIKPFAEQLYIQLFLNNKNESQK
ncbi:serine hydrolase domain-containing protein [Furfurilactobacillus entadae]|uniref:serine hydrolase domain-containing protein n=1 Tax=Furfurilactobacillus entadae TaxID=2922307 RepID=UPI0035E96A72